MVSLEQVEQHELSAWILQILSHTPYACLSLTRLSNGTTNFVFRGILTQPLPSRVAERAAAALTIIVKHSTDFVAVNKDFPLDVSRCLFEECMLNSLNNFASTSIAVKTPHFHMFDRERNIQVIEDIPNSLDLKSILVSPETNNLLTRPFATSIGQEIGSWLCSFHNEALAPAKADLRAEIGKNEPMRKLKYCITYDLFIGVLGNFPELVEGWRGTLEDVKEMATREFKKLAAEPEEGCEEWGIIHGDFWAGNVLLSNPISLGTQEPAGANKLFVIDWEFAQFGHRAYDLGQMIGDLYERKHFRDADSAIWVMEGFVDGYGDLSHEMAFRTAIHTGIHLIGWYTRRAPNSPLDSTPDKVFEAMKLGRDFVVKGWEKDKNWFQGSILAPLFKRR